MVRLIGKRCLLLSAFFALMVTTGFPDVLALEPTATIYPSEGTVFTDIFLQVRGLEKYLEGEYAPAAVGMELYVFWDDKIIIERQGDIMSGSHHLHIFDAHFNPPNEYPYSELGNHTIFAEVWKSSQFCTNFPLLFEIIEYVPCPEYISLNASYYALLVDYNDLLGNHSELLDSYDTVVTQFDYLNSSYYGLTSSYDSFNFTYHALQNMYNQLQSNYDDLQSKHDSLTSEIGTTRNLSYLFTITTIAFIATTVYLAVRKPKVTSEIKNK